MIGLIIVVAFITCIVGLVNALINLPPSNREREKSIKDFINELDQDKK